MSIFEILMLVCFGAAWPFSIYKSYKSKKTGGKSIFFLFVILFGYIFGVLHKLIFSKDFVILLYALNAIMVSIDILLYFRNKKMESMIKK
ncbi:MAG: PQ-loop domain-containing transporter [archaeon]